MMVVAVEEYPRAGGGGMFFSCEDISPINWVLEGDSWTLWFSAFGETRRNWRTVDGLFPNDILIPRGCFCCPLDLRFFVDCLKGDACCAFGPDTLRIVEDISCSSCTWLDKLNFSISGVVWSSARSILSAVNFLLF